MLDVVAPIFQDKVPVYEPAVSTEFPQLLVTETEGANGGVIGADVPVPGKLVHPFED